jgi:signal transduction histidine kinase
VSSMERTTWARLGRYGLVVLLAGVAIHNGAATAGGQYLTPRSAAAVVCALALMAPRFPWFVAATVTTATAGLWGWPMLPLLLLALFDLAARRRIAAAALCSVVVLASNTLTPPAVSLWRPQLYGSSLFLLLAVFMGLWMGSRHRLVQALHQQVDHLRVERQLREETARAAERSRIAAEMHDVLAHRLSLIALHTGVLTTRTSDLPAPVIERLALLRTASTEALADLRDILAALHDRQTTTGDAATAPVLRDVYELVEQAHAAGQHADLHVNGRADQASAAHRLALYRLVQEGLTNARKHAAGAAVHIRVDYGPPHTIVEVTNSPARTAEPTSASGFGLVGLRERVRALGGQFSAGPHGTGSWQLTARIPHPVPIERDGPHG